jgi:hypothetical protein
MFEGKAKSHRYLREVDCSRNISLKKIYFNQTGVLKVGTSKTVQQGRQADMAGRLTWQAG